MQGKEAAVRIAVLVKTAGLSPLQAAQLVKAAGDAAAVRARMEKDGLWDMLGRGGARAFGAVRSMFGGGGPKPPMAPRPAPPPSFGLRPDPRAPVGPAMPPPPPGMRMPTPAPGAGPRPAQGGGLFGPGMRFSPLRTAAAGAGLAVGGQHIANHYDNAIGPTMFGNNSAEDVFTRNKTQYDAARAGITQEMEKARAAGDLARFRELSGRLQRGDFAGPDSPRFDPATGFSGNPLRARMWGLNPWAAPTGGELQQRMLAAQRALHGEHAKALTPGAQPGDAEAARGLEQRLRSGDMLPDQAEALQHELAMLRERLGRPAGGATAGSRAVPERMRAAGMRLPPGFEAAAAGGGGGGGAGGGASVPWSYGRRPALPANLAALTGQPLLSNEFRPAPQPWDYQGPAAPGPFVHNGS